MQRNCKESDRGSTDVGSDHGLRISERTSTQSCPASASIIIGRHGGWAARREYVVQFLGSKVKSVSTYLD